MLELFMWKFGLFFPFCALFIFYIAVKFGNRWGFIAILSAVFVSGHFFHVLLDPFPAMFTVCAFCVV